MIFLLVSKTDASFPSRRGSTSEGPRREGNKAFAFGGYISPIHQTELGQLLESAEHFQNVVTVVNHLIKLTQNSCKKSCFEIISVILDTLALFFCFGYNVVLA